MKKIFFFSFIFIILIFFGLNSYFQLLLSKEKGWNYPREKSEIWDPDPILTMVNKKSAQVPFVFESNGKKVETLSSGIYTTNEWRVRLTPDQEKKHTDKFLALFGCSMIFGQGVNDKETLSYFLGQDLLEYKTYNFGVSAYGPHHLLAWLESGEIKKQVGQTNGIGIYSYITDHIYRVTRSHGVIPEFSTGQPFYQWNEQKKPERVMAPADNEDHLIHKFVRFISQNPLLKYFHLRFPKLFEKDFEFFCSLITKMQDVFLKDFPGSSFYVLFHPMGTDLNNWMDQKVYSCLEVKGIKIINLKTKENEKNFGQDIYINPDHLHPSKVGNKEISNLLVEYFKKNKIIK